MRLSYSQLEWFLRCPYLFKYQFIDKHPLPKGKDAVFGALLHSVMEYIYKQRPLYPTLTESLSFYENEWSKKELDSFFPSPLDASVHFKEGLRIITDYYQKNDIEGSKILALEKYFEVPISDPDTDETHLLTGRIDRIDKRDDGLEVIDYKTNRTLQSEEQIARNLQLALYHLGVASLWPRLVEKYHNNITVSLLFLRHQEKISAKKTQAELERTKEVTLEYIRKIQDSIKKDSFDSRPSPLCQMEPYSLICPYFKDRHRTRKPKIANQREVSEVIKEYLELKGEERKAKERLSELNELIHQYLDSEGLEGIYDGDVGILRSEIPTYELDRQALQQVLEPLGKWQGVLEVSKGSLEKVKSELPLEYREKINKAKKVKDITKSLRIKRL